MRSSGQLRPSIPTARHLIERAPGSLYWMKSLEANSMQMDVSKILAELKAERKQIEEAILKLERLARGRGRVREGHLIGWPM